MIWCFEALGSREREKIIYSRRNVMKFSVPRFGKTSCLRMKLYFYISFCGKKHSNFKEAYISIYISWWMPLPELWYSGHLTHGFVSLLLFRIQRPYLCQLFKLPLVAVNSCTSFSWFVPPPHDLETRLISEWKQGEKKI